MTGEATSRAERLRAVVHGRVQGVGFRWSVGRELSRLGLRGSAENLADGTVVVTATGPRAGVDGLVAWLCGDATPGEVVRVDVDRGPEAGEPSSGGS